MMYMCNVCGKEFDSSNKLNGHKVSHLPKEKYCCSICGKKYYTTEYGFKHHVTNHTKIYDNDFNKPNDNCYCKFCNKKCKNLNSLRQHEIRCKNNPDKIVMFGPSVDTFGDSRGWSKGLTKDTDERIKRQSIRLKEYYKTHSGSFLGRKLTQEHKDKISASMTSYDHSNNKRRTHGKGGYYDNVYFQSTWELCYYIHMKDLGENIQRCLKRYKYQYEGKDHYYTPDFIVENKIIEIKGYETELDIIKYSVVPNIKVLYYDDIKSSIEYVKSKYGVEDVSTIYQNIPE